MLEATGGSNAHRGAIWVLGLLVAALALAGSDAAPRETRGDRGGPRAPAGPPRVPAARATARACAARSAWRARAARRPRAFRTS